MTNVVNVIRKVEMQKNNLFFIDAETDGLYGKFLTVAIIVTDNNLNEIERAYFGIRKEDMDVKSKWVIENVLPILGEYDEVNSEGELLDKVWELWRKYADNAYAVANVPIPVESRLFAKCVEKDLSNREFQGPFPLIDISSMLLAKDINPLEERGILIGEHSKGNVHNALYDVEVMIKIYRKII